MDGCGTRYATYKQVQEMPGGGQLVGFTRILHRTQPDILMDEASAGACFLMLNRPFSSCTDEGAGTMASPLCQCKSQALTGI